MARNVTSILPEYDEEALRAPWASLTQRPALPMVGNASPAEQPGQSADAYAAAAAAEKAAGNEDAAARLAVAATETKAQENAAAGAPTPTTALPPLAPAASKQPSLMQGEPQLSAPMLQEPTPWRALAAGGQTPSEKGHDAAPYGSFGEPPEYEPPNQIGNFFGLALDAMFNKGRNAGRIVNAIASSGDSDYVNYRRRMKAAQDQAAIDATRRRGIETPEEQAMREARLKIAQDQVKLRGDQIANQTKSMQQRADKQAYDTDPNHDIANRVRENLYAQGVQPGSLDGLSLDAMKSGNNTALRNLVEQAQSTEMARVAAEKSAAQAHATEDSKIRVAEGISDATQDNKIELVREGQSGKEEAEGRADVREQSRRGEDFMKWYSKEAEKDLAIAKLIDKVDSTPGGVAPDLLERFKNVLTQRGIDPERVETYQAKHMILELWARQQSGAAISETEDARFAKQAALDPLASKEQIEAAYEVMRDVIGTWLRTKAAARPQEAMTVSQAAGLDTQKWFGGMPVAQSASPSQRKSAPRKTQSRPRAPKPLADEDLPTEVGEDAFQ